MGYSGNALKFTFRNLIRGIMVLLFILVFLPPFVVEAWGYSETMSIFETMEESGGMVAVFIFGLLIPLGVFAATFAKSLQPKMQYIVTVAGSAAGFLLWLITCIVVGNEGMGYIKVTFWPVLAMILYVAVAVFAVLLMLKMMNPDAPVNGGSFNYLFAGTNRPAPQYGAPQAPQYGAPQAPQYGAPQAPQYGAPQAPQYGAPQAPQYGAPQAPQYGAPQAPQYSAPQAPQYSAPQAPQYSAPQAPQYSAPQAPQYSAPQAAPAPEAAPAPAPVSEPAPAPAPQPAEEAPRFCPACGAPLEAGAAFCPQCGNKIG